MATHPHAARQGAHQGASMHQSHMGHYARFALMLALSFAVMYVFMYAMVNELPNAVPNVNTAYMAGLMTAPMLVFELALMGSMYPSKRFNAVLMAVGVVAAIALWSAIRTQAAVGDAQFVRSMIPHHAGAILMCREASIADAEVRKLCGEIVQSQQREIDQMKRILARLSD